MLEIDLGFNAKLTVPVRLHGVKIPSRHSANAQEREDALQALDLVRSQIGNRLLRIRARPPRPEEDEKLFHVEVSFLNKEGREADLAAVLVGARLAERTT